HRSSSLDVWIGTPVWFTPSNRWTLRGRRPYSPHSMKIWFLAMAALIAVCHGQTDAKAEFDAKIRNFWKNEILDDLKDATTIVLCEFKAPGGYIITRVIRGDDNVKVGQFWNSFGSSGKQHHPPLLIWQKVPDHIGDGP